MSLLTLLRPLPFRFSEVDNTDYPILRRKHESCRIRLLLMFNDGDECMFINGLGLAKSNLRRPESRTLHINKFSLTDTMPNDKEAVDLPFCSCGIHKVYSFWNSKF